MTRPWQDSLVQPDAPVREALRVLDEGGRQIALVVDADQRLLGTLTDGDVRRGILRGASLDEPVSRFMNTTPTVARADDDRAANLDVMKRKELRQLPIIDADNRLVGIETLTELLAPVRQRARVVLMAGGMGTRLAPLTDRCPKPMLAVGGRPLLETTILRLAEAGFHDIHLSVNYLAHLIEGHFGDGSAYGVTISYVREPAPLGTAGALGLLPPSDEPTLVMNADILAKIDFAKLLAFHRRSGALATMGAREHAIQVPFGVVTVEDGRLVAIEEKPTQRFAVNAGLYVLAPAALARIVPGEVLTMPALFERLLESGDGAAVYPVKEYWRDIGHLADLERADVEYGEIFG